MKRETPNLGIPAGVPAAPGTPRKQPHKQHRMSFPSVLSRCAAVHGQAGTPAKMERTACDGQQGFRIFAVSLVQGRQRPVLVVMAACLP